MYPSEKPAVSTDVAAKLCDTLWCDTFRCFFRSELQGSLSEHNISRFLSALLYHKTMPRLSIIVSKFP